MLPHFCASSTGNLVFQFCMYRKPNPGVNVEHQIGCREQDGKQKKTHDAKKQEKKTHTASRYNIKLQNGGRRHGSASQSRKRVTFIGFDVGKRKKKKMAQEPHFFFTLSQQNPRMRERILSVPWVPAASAASVAPSTAASIRTTCPPASR